MRGRKLQPIRAFLPRSSHKHQFAETQPCKLMVAIVSIVYMRMLVTIRHDVVVGPQCRPKRCCHREVIIHG